MFSNNSHIFKEIKSFDLKDLHKKFGRIILQEPTDSCIQEGNFMSRLWFQTGENLEHLWLIAKWDSRHHSSNKK